VARTYTSLPTMIWEVVRGLDGLASMTAATVFETGEMLDGPDRLAEARTAQEQVASTKPNGARSARTYAR
jgi:hypothetical protein